MAGMAVQSKPTFSCEATLFELRPKLLIFAILTKPIHDTTHNTKTEKKIIQASTTYKIASQRYSNDSKQQAVHARLQEENTIACSGLSRFGGQHGESCCAAV
eukprot:3253500-Pleurochrysis_carterae.AAC.6